MFFWLFIILLFVFIYYFINNKIKIKFRTFFKKGFKVNRGKFGVYCYCGKQGKGKTYSCVEFLLENTDFPIYANLDSLDSTSINYTKFSGLDGLLSLSDKKHCIIMFDEIFTLLTKQTKMTTDVLSFLSQMRKREIIFITTAQEWLEINMTLRRYCRYQIECNIINLFGKGILIKKFYDAEQMKWSQIDNEYVAPIISTTISKCNIDVANKYDTYEQIKNIVKGSA